MIEMLVGNLAAPEGPNPIGQAQWINAGTHEWVCPPDVTSVCCVVVAAGECGVFPTSANTGKPGAGGGVRWKNFIEVIPGNTYQIKVGQPALATGQNPPALSYTGVHTAIGDVTSSALGLTAGAGTIGTPFGDGVNGGYGEIGRTYNQYSTGGSSGGYRNGTTPRVTPNGYSGHGVDLIGNDLTNGGIGGPAYPNSGGQYGGGGQTRNATNSSDVKMGRSGGRGGVRIMWGRGRSYPDQAANVIV